MGKYIDCNKLVIITALKTIHFELTKNAGKKKKIIKHNNVLADLIKKIEISQLLFKYKH